MHLSKTDFIRYLNCPESFWLAKKKPEKYPKGELSLFLQKLVNEGYEVESYVGELFQDPVVLPQFASTDVTDLALQQNDKVFLQAAFKTPKGVNARVDVLQRLEDGTWHLYEVKSSSKVSTKSSHNHIYDVCFQKYVIERNNLTVSKCSIIHLNSDFVKNGAIKAEDLLTITDVTKEVGNSYSGIVNEIHTALNLLEKKLDLKSCSCLRKTRSNHCETFKLFNNNIQEPSIYELKLLSKKKVNILVDSNSYSLIDIPKGFELSTGQQLQYDSFVQKKPIINNSSIKQTIDDLVYPLHFFDYEAYGSAIPRINDLKPFEQVPFQVSIHTMQEDGNITHFEYLSNTLEFPMEMLKQMKQFTGLTGTFVSWHASYEIGANKRMKKWIPEFTSYLDFINTHMFDLEKIFLRDYIDYRFKGSSSIKKVLPVLVPDLNYNELEVQEGTAAMDLWERLVLKNEFENNSLEIRKSLLEYCKLDSWAMVEIFKVLANHG